MLLNWTVFKNYLKFNWYLVNFRYFFGNPVTGVIHLQFVTRTNGADIFLSDDYADVSIIFTSQICHLSEDVQQKKKPPFCPPIRLANTCSWFKNTFINIFFRIIFANFYLEYNVIGVCYFRRFLGRYELALLFKYWTSYLLRKAMYIEFIYWILFVS